MQYRRTNRKFTQVSTFIIKIRAYVYKIGQQIENP